MTELNAIDACLALPPEDPPAAPTHEEVLGAAGLVRALRERHQPPEWATFEELADGTGAQKNRTIDLFAMSCYPSKGFLRIAYEVKISRADFRRELDDRSKRAPWEALANETWYVAPPRVILEAEVPEDWGLLERKDGKWRTVKRPRHRYVGPPPITFTASFARRAADPAPAEPLKAWDFLGRRITASDLMSLAGKYGRRDRDDRVEAAHVRADQVRRQTAEQNGRLLAAVRYACNARTADEFHAWLRSSRLLTPDRIARLSTLRSLVDELLSEEP